jgi:glycosyltransferase involved in cell wall biosynthesis
MKIGIDATSLTKERITGIENYVRNLIIELSKLDTDDQFSLYLPGKPYQFPALPSNFTIISSPNRKYWSQRELPKLINSDIPDVVYFPTNIIPSGIKCRVVYHFHDLAWKFFPQAYSFSERLRQKLAVRRAKKFASVIITGSQSAKDDLSRFMKVDQARIKVIPLGYDPKIKEYSTPQSGRSGIVYCGRLEMRKNVVNLLDGYQEYAKSTEHPEELVLVGAPGYGYDLIKTQIDFLQKAGYKVKELNYAPPEDFYKLLGQSKVLLFPSLYEGFGLPILEAFATETAVVTSKISSMPEVAGNGAMLVDPTDTHEIASALNELINSEQKRTELIRKDRLRLSHYSWESTAKQVLEVLTDAK